MADRGGGAVTEGSEGPPPHPPSGVEGADVLVRPKVSISVMRAALAAAGVPIAGLLERAEFEEIYIGGFRRRRRNRRLGRRPLLMPHALSWATAPAAARATG